MPKRQVASLIGAVILSAASVHALAQSWQNPPNPAPAPEKQAPSVERNLAVFDTLDFDVFSNQKWDRRQQSHA
jgi:hypothetical protein